MELLLWLPFAALCLATIACQVGYMDDAKNRGGAIAPTGLRSKPNTPSNKPPGTDTHGNW